MKRQARILVGRKDLRTQSDNELKIIVLNDRMLYDRRNRFGFKGLLDDCFLYTDEQFLALEKALEQDKETA